MAKVLVFAEQRDGKLKRSSLEIVAASSKAGHETHVALLGSGVDALAKEIGTYGAATVHVVSNEALKNYTADAYTAALHGVMKSVSPEWVCGSHTPLGRDLLPRVAARTGGGLASDCTQVNFSGSITVRRPVYAGKATVEVEFVGGGTKFLTIRPNALGLPPPDAGKSAQTTAAAVDLGTLKTKFIEFAKGTSSRPDVTEAGIVVSGGRSMKNAENFKILEELADVLGGAVGASRAAVDAGFRPHRDQVGQTGKVVSPSLYMAFGISGAIQHLAGMRTSKVIVAVNLDGEAPIFQLADYGIVGDLFTLVPLLKEEFKKIKDH